MLANSQQDSAPDASLSDISAATTAQNPLGPLGNSVLANAIVAYDKATKTSSSSDDGIAAVKKFAQTIDPGITYKTYATTDIKTDTDSSKERVLSYRADLRVALEPLLKNTDNELDLFAQYVETKDPQYLATLRATIANYQLAIANTEKVIAPADAASYHAAILSALSQFSTTLTAMTENATDPIASAVLLKAYTNAQDNMLASFNAIGGYAAQKML